MNVPGFTLLLQEFCSYCPDFESRSGEDRLLKPYRTGQILYKYSLYAKGEMCKTCYKHSKAGNHRCLSLTPSTTLELLLKP